MNDKLTHTLAGQIHVLAACMKQKALKTGRETRFVHSRWLVIEEISDFFLDGSQKSLKMGIKSKNRF